MTIIAKYETGCLKSFQIFTIVKIGLKLTVWPRLAQTLHSAVQASWGVTGISLHAWFQILSYRAASALPKDFSLLPSSHFGWFIAAHVSTSGFLILSSGPLEKLQLHEYPPTHKYIIKNKVMVYLWNMPAMLSMWNVLAMVYLWKSGLSHHAHSGVWTHLIWLGGQHLYPLSTHLYHFSLPPLWSFL